MCWTLRDKVLYIIYDTVNMKLGTGLQAMDKQRKEGHLKYMLVRDYPKCQTHPVAGEVARIVTFKEFGDK